MKDIFHFYNYAPDTHYEIVFMLTWVGILLFCGIVQYGGSQAFIYNYNTNIQFASYKYYSH